MKKILQIMAVVVLLVALTASVIMAQEKEYIGKVSAPEPSSCIAENVMIESLEYGRARFSEWYEEELGEICNLLNTEELSEAIWDTPLENITDATINEYQAMVANEFTVKPYDGELFPQELVAELEETLYRCNDYDYYSDSEAYAEIFTERLAQYDSDYEMNDEEIKDKFPEAAENENFISAFQFCNADGRDNYLLCYDSGGSAGLYNWYVYEEQDGEPVEICYFDTQNYGYGNVIKYEDDFYYVFLQNNYQSKSYDGIRIHKLGAAADTENLLIRYMPKDYVWKTLYGGDDSEELDQYISKVQEEFEAEGYLNMDGGAGKYMGCEVEVPDFPLTEKYKKYYKADIANIGEPIYFYKGLFETSNSSLAMHMQAFFFLYDEYKEQETELAEWAVEGGVAPHDNELMQLWFQEFDGEVYTFQIFYLANDLYLLNVELIEEDNVTIIRQEMIMPQKAFDLSEGVPFIF